MKDSPTKRTLALFRKRGWHAAVAEYWQPSFANQRVVDAAKQFAKQRCEATQHNLMNAVRGLNRSLPGVRKDLFGFIDIVAVTDTNEIVAYQATSTPNMSARRAKILSECGGDAKAWLQAGGRIVVIGWKEYAERVDRRKWRETENEITLADVMAHC